MKTLSALVFATATLTAFACGDDDPSPATDAADAIDAAAPDANLGNPAMPALGTQIDRVGRPAITTALQATFVADTATKNAAKDAYNAAAPAEWPQFADSLATSLGIIDSLDRNCGNQLLAGDMPVAGRYEPLAGVLADDQLYVDSESGTCGVYLGVEAEATGVLASGEGGCGGRLLTDDVIDRSYSVLAAGALSGVGDTIDADPDCSPREMFPFLCAPAN